MIKEKIQFVYIRLFREMEPEKTQYKYDIMYGHLYSMFGWQEDFAARKEILKETKF